MTVTNNTPPVVTGTPRQGQILQTSDGTWVYDLDVLSYTYRWLRCDVNGANCAAISGATSQRYTLQSADVGSRIRSEVTATESAFPTPPGGGLLSWAPPGFPSYSGYQQRTISNSSFNHSVTPGSNIDAVFNWTEVITDSGNGTDRRVKISGFRNVVIIGGEHNRTYDGAVVNNSVGIQIDRCNGIVHLEGLYLHGKGMSDCFVFTSGPESGGFPGATVRIQNCHVTPNSLFGNHGDGIQIWGDPGGGWNGGFNQMDIDHLTIRSTYQGIFFGTHDGCMRGADIRNTNIKGVAKSSPNDSQAGMGWIFAKTKYPDVGGFTSICTLTNVYGENSARAWGTYAHMVTPNDLGQDATGGSNPARVAVNASDINGSYVHWPNANSDIKGQLRVGDPPGGDFCPVGTPGVNYVSPGYV